MAVRLDLAAAKLLSDTARGHAATVSWINTAHDKMTVEGAVNIMETIDKCITAAKVVWLDMLARTGDIDACTTAVARNLHPAPTDATAVLTEAENAFYALDTKYQALATSKGNAWTLYTYDAATRTNAPTLLTSAEKTDLDSHMNSLRLKLEVLVDA